MPGKEHNQITCRLKQADLQNALTYEAISYVWGDAAIRRTITCDGSSFEVTANLFLALQRLRKPDAPRFLWADAICINQQDVDERGQQVSIMKKIYEMAARVLVWLGPDAEDYSVPAARLTRMVLEELCRASNMEISAFGTLKMECLDDVLLAADASRLPPGHSEVWKPLAWLLSRPWFNRVWVVQEAVSARRLVVLCGDLEFDWDALGSTASWVQKQVMQSGFADFKRFEHTFTFEASNLYDRDYSEHSDWVEVLSSYRSLASTDPRDKVYALLGLPSFSQISKTSTSISPDYNKSKLEVYTDVVETAIRSYRNLRILSYVQYGPTLPKDWPTWIPSWDTSLDVGGLDSQVEGFAYRASGDVEIGSYGDGWKIENSILTLRGISVDTVKEVGGLMTLDHFHILGVASDSSHPIIRFFKETLNESWGIPTDHRLEQIASLCFGLTAGLNIDHMWAISPPEHTHQHLADFAAYMSRLVGSTESVSDLCEVLDPDKEGQAERYEVPASRACDQRRLLITAQGYIGIGPAAMQCGDRVCILFGDQQPVILRPQDANYQFVGEAYLYDIMFGEALKEYNRGSQADEEFNLC